MSQFNPGVDDVVAGEDIVATDFNNLKNNVTKFLNAQVEGAGIEAENILDNAMIMPMTFSLGDIPNTASAATTFAQFILPPQIGARKLYRYSVHSAGSPASDMLMEIQQYVGASWSDVAVGGIFVDYEQASGDTVAEGSINVAVDDTQMRIRLTTDSALWTDVTVALYFLETLRSM